ncbi:MAG: Eco57I restriction-modification methylase domain-containing protein, partial [Bacteroidales bacterium]|nr:Eco57I restriction-modification methylase domain-containing protein [Bacteroidales bacterium]
MGKIYSNVELRTIFQSSFNLGTWQALLKDFFHSKELRLQPEYVGGKGGESGFYLGALDTEDHYRIGLFWYEITKGSVVHKKVGLRRLVKSFINPNWGEFDAALAVFSEGNHWRLSLICDIKEEAMSPRRFTYVFGDENSFYNTPIDRFEFLQKNGITFENLKNAFSVEALTKQFYNELFDWYQWAVKDETGVTFPNNTATEDDDREQIDTKIIRLITRLMFVWFIKQKDLVPSKLFDAKQMKKVIKDFDPQSKTSGNYYNAILQNLFFATLNRAIVDEDGKTRCFDKTVGRGVKTTYRYSELFSISEEEVIKMFADVPFLNGGLFECLDKTKTIDGVEKDYNYDGFSRNDKKFADGRYRNRAFVPNNLFFDPEYGLFSILNRYNFTIEENTPNEQQVALDPELLGKVFENLLGAYNPETKETARNQSGSFYTPREVVNYMVDESLVAYLGDTSLVRSLLSDDFVYESGKAAEYKDITAKLKSIKILDPACGSGAFPMGLLNRIVDVLEKISPEDSLYQLKLTLIENCIYGIDIQSIAVQISKLRFFISLICDCEKDPSKPNFGIPTLPNLETKFVCANSLIDKQTEDSQGNLFEDPRIQETKDKLIDLRNEHFRAKSASQKRRLRESDDELRKFLAQLLAENDMASRADAEQMARWNPYDQNASSEFFSAEWMFNVKDGFDLVIGNPPYIQLQNNSGELGKLYAPCGYQSFASTGDIYCLFYERGWQLLKKSGHLCYITSNKWMRAGYGEKLRTFLATKTNPQLLIDFGGVKVFESATVDTNILLFEKGANAHKTLCAVTNKQNKDSLKQLSVFVQQQGTICDFSGGDSWVILSPIEQSIKRKIEAVGTPLKDWDINIYRGVLTGYNEAFIISTEKRDEILANCKTNDERERTEELIRPILRGRDIKRYGYEWAKLYLIATFPARHYDIEQYPAVKQYLLSFAQEYLIANGNEWVANGHLSDFCKQKLAQTGQYVIINGKYILDKKGNKEKGRKKTSNKWFETQDSISYWEDFIKPKIIYREIGFEMDACIAPANWFINNKLYLITGNDIEYLLAFL